MKDIEVAVEYGNEYSNNYEYEEEPYGYHLGINDTLIPLTEKEYSEYYPVLYHLQTGGKGKYDTLED